jgi:hypothetical protein
MTDEHPGVPRTRSRAAGNQEAFTRSVTSKGTVQVRVELRLRRCSRAPGGSMRSGHGDLAGVWLLGLETSAASQTTCANEVPCSTHARIGYDQGPSSLVVSIRPSSAMVDRGRLRRACGWPGRVNETHERFRCRHLRHHGCFVSTRLCEVLENTVSVPRDSFMPDQPDADNAGPEVPPNGGEAGSDDEGSGSSLRSAIRDDHFLDRVLAVVAIAIGVVVFVVKSPNTALGRLWLFPILAIAAFLIVIRGGSHRRVVISAVIMALSAAATGVAAVQQFTKQPLAGPQIEITRPIDGAWISRHPLIKGSLTPLASGQEVFSFNEPFTTKGLSRPTGKAYPDAGPCHSSGHSFTCAYDFPGGTASTYCQKYNLWVAIVTIQKGNEYNNIKSGTGPRENQTFVKVDENNGPRHIGTAVDHITVQRYPRSQKSC